MLQILYFILYFNSIERSNLNKVKVVGYSCVVAGDIICNDSEHQNRSEKSFFLLF